MASFNPQNDFSPITIKINADGAIRRFRLCLHDLSPKILIGKLRSLLAIPPTSEAIFERYSDRAAAYVVLDPKNVQVFKQLHRAARAKSRLRLKVTVTPRLTASDKDGEDSIESSNKPQSSTSSLPSSNVPPPEAPLIQGSLNEFQARLKNLLLNETKTKQSEVPAMSNAAPQYAESKISEDSQSVEDSQLKRKSNFPSPFDVNLFIPVAEKKQENSGVPTPKESLEKIICSKITEISEAPPPKYLEKTICSKNTEISEATTLESKIQYTIFCNNCNASTSKEHYHCSNCDGGDYDLCPDCVRKGVYCPGRDHWLIKRVIENDKIINSTTKIIPPKNKSDSKSDSNEYENLSEADDYFMLTRTCNSCIEELSERNFVTCTSCPDFDLCIRCHVNAEHGHHPKHRFEPATKDTKLDNAAKALLAPGRNVRHAAICDGCFKCIRGIRYKCLDCPNFDLCSSCITTAETSHSLHRFIPIYDPLDHGTLYREKVWHEGIHCDGLCGKDNSLGIFGDRYKCTICHDVDFCASCEASPLNTHNRTHPLIKMKTPVREMFVTAILEDNDNENKERISVPETENKNKNFGPTILTNNKATQVQTAVDDEPLESLSVQKFKNVEATITEHEEALKKSQNRTVLPQKEDLIALYIRDTIADGTTMSPSENFEQTWYLRNGGNTAWPAGCCVKFSGGANMFSVASSSSKKDGVLLPVTESISSIDQVTPGQIFGFKVLMKAPDYPGNFVSYWRLTTPDGSKIGHRLWCDINVKLPEIVKEANAPENDTKSSQMIFPKLEKEAPSMNIDSESTEQIETDDEYIHGSLEESPEEQSDEGFITDDEYEILDASDEIYADQQISKRK